jgi:hypothetical protein
MAGDMHIKYFYRELTKKEIINFLEALSEENCSINGRVYQYKPHKSIPLYQENDWRTEFPKYKDKMAALLLEGKGGSIGTGIIFPNNTAYSFDFNANTQKENGMYKLRIFGEWFWNVFQNINDLKGNEDRLIHIMKTIYYKTKPLYAYFDTDAYYLDNHVDYAACTFTKFNYINFFSKEFVDCFGRSALLNAKVYRIEELDDGGIMTVAVPIGKHGNPVAKTGGLDYPL